MDIMDPVRLRGRRKNQLDPVRLRGRKFIDSLLNGFKLCRKTREKEDDEEKVNDCSVHHRPKSIRDAKASSSVSRLPDQACLISIQNMLEMEPQKLRASKTCCIYRLPPRFHLRNKYAYTPQFVSIGPFHRGAERLQVMEEHKGISLRSVLSRAPPGTLERYMVAVKELEVSARDCYSETINLSSKDFVQIMVVDGCFIIDLFCRGTELWTSDSAHFDPILNNQWLLSSILNDLLMLENQIPFFILQCLFDLTEIPEAYCLTHLAHLFFQSRAPYNEEIINDHSRLGSLHLLHLFHSSLLPLSNPNQQKELEEREKKKKKVVSLHMNSQLVPCVTALLATGIKFKKRKKSQKGSFLDIRFKKGVIVIPSIAVEDCTNCLFLNLIAFEQCYNYCGKYFTCYTTFIDYLIKSSEDVAILSRYGIIDNYLGSDEDVADLFKKMGKEVHFNLPYNFYLKDVVEQINDSYSKIFRKKFHVWQASLMLNYFSNPWSTVSVIAAVVLLLLATVQTIFTVFPKLHFS